MVAITGTVQLGRRGLIFLLAFAFLVLCAISYGARTAKVSPSAHATNSDQSYTEQISKTYDFKFGPNPFAPGNATTTTGTFIPGEMFVPSKRCGNCHTDAHAQWRQSAHGNAFREPFYQKNVKDLQTQKGIEYTRHCESCHNPAALFTGALTKNSHVNGAAGERRRHAPAQRRYRSANSRRHSFASPRDDAAIVEAA